MLIIPFHPSPMGGAELQAVKLAKKLTADGSNVFIVTSAVEGEKAEDSYEGIPVYRVKRLFEKPEPKQSDEKKVVKIEFEKNRKENFTVQTKKSIFAVPNYFAFYFRVLFLLRSKKLKVNIVYVPMVEWIGYIGTLIASRIKAKVFIKDSTMNGVSNLLRYPFGARMHSTIVKNANFIAMTNVIRKNFVAAGINENRIFNVPNGVPLPAKPDRNNISRNKFVFVGNLYQQPAKGVDILLKAWKIVLSQRSGLQLEIIGDGAVPEYHDYVRQLGISDNVAFLGKRKDIPQLLDNAYAFVLPSRREGMSNALLEAMSRGLPCIATDISGSRDLLSDGISGLVVPVENEEILAEKIIYLYDNPELAGSMGVEARKTIENGFTQDQVSAKYADVFKNALS